jgi:hypothetical protein
MAIADTAMLDKPSLTQTGTRTRPQTIRMASSGKKSRELGFCLDERTTQFFWFLIICVIFGNSSARDSLYELDPMLVKVMPPRQRVEMPGCVIVKDSIQYT